MSDSYEPGWGDGWWQKPENWVEVVCIGWWDNEWEEMRVYHDGERFFWFGDEGCSCNGWGEGLRDSDFSFGDRDAVLRAADEFSRDAVLQTDIIRAKETIRRYALGA